MTREGRVKAKVDALLKKYGVYYLKPVQNGMGAPAVDYHCIANGFGFVIETKAPGKDLTSRQRATFAKVQAAGGWCFYVFDDGGLSLLEGWLIATIKLKENPFDKPTHAGSGDSVDEG